MIMIISLVFGVLSKDSGSPSKFESKNYLSGSLGGSLLES
jgi:hypothetical protein